MENMRILFHALLLTMSVAKIDGRCAMASCPVHADQTSLIQSRSDSSSEVEMTNGHVNLLQTSVKLGKHIDTSNSAWYNWGMRTAPGIVDADSFSGCDLGELEWAVSVDGRDAGKGRNAYNYNTTFQVMHKILHGSSAYSFAELSLDIMEEIHNDCCALETYREPWFGPPMSGDFKHFSNDKLHWHWQWNATEQFHGILGMCMSLCKDVEIKRSLAMDLPDDLLHIIYSQEGPKADRHIDQILLKVDIDPRESLRKLVSKYNDDLQAAFGSHHLKTEALSRFLRSIAWLHPYVNKNGRFRNFLLQREIRRLGLGRCAMMYNNNRDIYFTNTSEYAEKIREGIVAADETRATGQNAWLDLARVAKHLERFKPSAFASCDPMATAGTWIGKLPPDEWGTILFDIK